MRQHKLTYDILQDAGNQVARQYGLVFALPDYLRPVYTKLGAELPAFNGDDSWTLPLAARYVIGRDSTIHAADVNPDYTIRPDPGETIAVLKTLREK